MRKVSFFIFFLTIFSSYGQSKKEVASKKNKPNIIMILVDDLKPALGVYGDKTAVSPNIDELAKMGVRFDLAYANQAVCAPSRYNLMLGSRSTSTGIYSFGIDFRKIYPNAITLPQYFKNAGYHTESMGKVYHIGHGNDNDTESWSVPHHEDKVIEYVDPKSTDRKLTREEVFFQNTRKYYKNVPKMNDLPRGAAWENPDVLDNAYADARVANHAVNRLRILNENKEKPFFLAVGFARPHLPFSVPKKYWDLYNPDELPMPEFEKDPTGTPKFAIKGKMELTNFKPIPNTKEVLNKGLKTKLIHGYYASVSYMDAQVGKVIDELKRLNILENTIIVLWGDHGWHLGDHGSWTKHSNFEQATRIPIIFAGKGIVSNKTSQQLIETVDIYPTLADLSGLEKPTVPQPFDGISVKPVLEGWDVILKNHIYHSYPKGGYIGQAIRTERYRLVEWTHMKDKKAEKIFELYDYLDDPLETKNHAQLKPEVFKKLKQIINKHPKPVVYANHK